MKKILLSLIILYPLTCLSVSPEQILPQGIDSAEIANPFTGEKGNVRKGTIGATINNIAKLNKLFESNNANLEKNSEFQAAINDIKQLIPSLKILGMFDLFTLDQYLSINKTKQWGRVICGLLYYQQYPVELNNEIISQLKDLKKASAPKFVEDKIDELIVVSSKK